MKRSKPWYWTKRQGWYTEVRGKQVLLGKAEKKTVTPPRAVMQEFYRVMAAEGMLADDDKRGACVEDAVEAMIASKRHLRSGSVANYKLHLGALAEGFAGRRLSSLSGSEVVEYIRNYAGSCKNNRTFNDPGRHVMFRMVDAFLRWARDAGYSASYIWHSTENPWKVVPRGRGMTEAEYLTVMNDPSTKPCFKEVVDFLYRTGARPGEIACLSARHLDPDQPIARLKPAEHKTGGKTGLDREIIFPPDLMERLRAYAVLRPTGALLRNEKGKAWTGNLISCRFIYVRDRLGLDPKLCVHMARHSFGTRAMEAGTPIEVVANMLGHRTTDELMKTYYHPDKKTMVGVAASVGAKRVSASGI